MAINLKLKINILLDFKELIIKNKKKILKTKNSFLFFISKKAIEFIKKTDLLKYNEILHI